MIKEFLKYIINAIQCICLKISNVILKIFASFINLFIEEED